jgi:hypothetical protein
MSPARVDVPFMVVGGKSTLRIAFFLLRAPRRNGELKRLLPTISQQDAHPATREGQSTQGGRAAHGVPGFGKFPRADGIYAFEPIRGGRAGRWPADPGVGREHRRSDRGVADRAHDPDGCARGASRHSST